MSLYISLKKILNKSNSIFLVILVSIFYVLFAVGNIIAAIGLGKTIDLIPVIGEVDGVILLSFSLLLLMGKIIASISEFIAGMIQNRIAKNLNISFRMYSVEQYLKAEYSWTQENKSGDLLSRIEEDVDAAVTVVSELVPLFLRSLSVILIMTLVLFLIDWRLGVCFLLPVPFMLMSQYYGGKKAEEAMEVSANKYGESNALIQDLLNNRTTIKAFGLEDHVTNLVRKNLYEYTKAFSSAMALMVTVLSPSRILSVAPSLLVCGIGCALVANGNLGVETFITGITMVTIMANELNSIDVIASNLPQLMAKAKRLMPIWEAPLTKEGECRSFQQEREEVIQFRDVCFSYDKRDETAVITNFSLQIKKGERIVIIGSSGCGKSTILKLMNGLYVPSSGVIEVFGKSPRMYAHDYLPELVGTISQEEVLFPGTILENIKKFNPDVDERFLNDILDITDVTEMVKSIPKGLHAEVGEKGIKLSGGQRQLVALARLLLNDPQIILLDEATSALDTTSEEAVNKALKRISKGKTIIMVTHKSTEMIGADRIILMDKGRVVEIGSYDELSSLNRLLKA